MSRENGSGRLGVRQAVSMAVGGMIGGGIFSVLGVVVEVAGHLAVASFVLGGALALATAHSYARLTVAAEEGGGSFAFLRRAGHEDVAGWIVWLLVLGYVFTISVYAFTFGHYLANVLGIAGIFARGFGLAIIALFVVVNLRGVSTSGTTEDLIVLGKMLVLGVVAAGGLAHFSSAELEPLANEGIVGIFLGASVIFMAYEGFQLLAYDVDAMDRPGRTLPLALYIAVPSVIVTYVLVTLGSQMLVPDRVLVEQKEVALAAVGEELLGTAGLVVVSIGAAFSTGSAINATLFATARLTRDVGGAGEFPERVAEERGDVPWVAVVALGVLAAAFSLMPGIEQIVAFGSLTFLVVFGIVNLLHARLSARSPLERGVAYSGAVGALAAVGGLVFYLATEERLALLVVAGAFVALASARLVFLRRRG